MDEYHKTARMVITVPGAGRYSYDLEATAVFRDKDRKMYDLMAVGQGMIDISAGKSFELTSVRSGDTWIGKMEEIQK